MWIGNAVGDNEETRRANRIARFTANESLAGGEAGRPRGPLRLSRQPLIIRVRANFSAQGLQKVSLVQPDIQQVFIQILVMISFRLIVYTTSGI